MRALTGSLLSPLSTCQFHTSCSFEASQVRADQFEECLSRPLQLQTVILHILDELELAPYSSNTAGDVFLAQIF